LRRRGLQHHAERVKNMLATECSKPAATKAEIGGAAHANLIPIKSAAAARRILEPRRFTMAFNRRQIIELAYALTTRRNQLLDEIRSDVERVRAEPYASVAGTTPDIGDEAVADLLSDVGEAEVTRDLGELRLLEAALKRVSDGSYGLCVDCGEDIPFERLRAQPGAERCVACQGRHEKTYKA
jgi:RNA polymerase-binding transcription factor